MKQAISKLTVAIIVVLGLCSTASAAIEVSLRDRVALSGSVVRLADVAEISAGDGELGRQLAALPLMPAPAPGTQRFLRRRQIADLLAAHGVDLKNVRFEGATQVEIASEGDGWKSSQPAAALPPATRVNRHAAILSGQPADAVEAADTGKSTPDTRRTAKVRDELSRAIATYLESKVGQAATWVVNCEVVDRHLALLAEANGPLEVRGGSAPWTGRQRFMVAINTVNGVLQVPVYAQVGATSMPVVVALQPIERGAPITAADVALQAVDHLPATNGRRTAAQSTEELIGMEARQSIRAGDVVFTDQVRPPILVKRGEMISISSHAGGIRVRTTARARDDGARGDLLQVESLETRERFEARVVGTREASVFAQNRVDNAQQAENGQ